MDCMQCKTGCLNVFRQTMKSRIASFTPTATSKVLRESAANQYLLADQKFLRLMSVLIYWPSGLPPRRKELVGAAWCNNETARNLYISPGLVALITGYHKSEWRIGTRRIAQFLSPAVGHLLVRYLIYVPSFVRFLQSCMQSALNPGFLFWDRDHVCSADHFGQSAQVLASTSPTRISTAPMTVVTSVMRRRSPAFDCTAGKPRIRSPRIRSAMATMSIFMQA